jgi:hypothetical protein
MPEHADKLLPPVLTAMSALDAAVGEHDRLVEQLGAAVQEAARRDDELRGVDFADAQRLAAATQAYATAVSTAQRLSWREQQARRARERAQEALAQARKVQSRARSELLRIELEIDAASIWDMVGRFEQQVRKRLEDHSALAAEMGFAAKAAGEESAMALEASTLAPALGTSGPALWSALAGGVRLLYDKTGSLPVLPAAETPPPPVSGRAPVLEIAPVSDPPPLAEDTPAPPVAPQSDPPAFTRPQAQPAAPAAPAAIDDALFEGLPPVATPPPPVLARNVTLKAASTPPPQPTPPRKPPPPPPGADDAHKFDFGKPQAATGKSDPPSFAARPPQPARVESLPPTAENKRGRLDRMLRNLAGMVGPRRPPERARRSGDK